MMILDCPFKEKENTDEKGVYGMSATGREKYDLPGYERWLREQERSEVTIRKYLQNAHCFLKALDGTELTKERTLAYKELLISGRYRVRSVNSMIAALNSLFKWFTKRDKHRPSLFHALLMLGFAIFLSVHSDFITSSASLVFAVWITINAIAKYIYAYQLWKTKSRGEIRTLLQGILYSLFAGTIFSDLAGSAVSLSWLRSQILIQMQPGCNSPY